MNVELHQVRDEIRHADEAVVRDLAGATEETDDGWAVRASVRRRIALGKKVAACKFRMEPERFRALAGARNEPGLERAITDTRMEEAVLERIRKQARELECAEALAKRMTDFYRTRIIPETKQVQIRMLRGSMMKEKT